MVDGSTQPLSTLVAYSTGVGGVDSKVGTSSVDLQATQATGRILVSSSSAALQFITAVGAANSYLPLGPQLIVAAGTGVTGTIDVPSPPVQMPYIRATGTINPVSATRASLQLISGVAAALNGGLGTSVAAFQTLFARGIGAPLAIGTSSVSLLPITARGIGFVSTGATFSAVVLQTQIQGITTYSNFAFNSFARFNGVSLAAGDSGLFTLVGANDNGTPIQAAVAGPITDFNTSFLKRVERVYIGYRSAVDMVLRVRTNEVNVRDYRVPGNTATGLHGTHVKLGRGLEARYWQFELRNQNGGAFTLNMIECKPTKLERRVGGTDA